ncbi:MAG: glycoside hydrolase family 28 protein [Verrucomicrobia bacterium]|nr:glycoside hydrolase family 28 protein [Verrucomicrobiota bacterium]
MFDGIVRHAAAFLFVTLVLAVRAEQCDITRFGAVGDGKTLNTKTIQAAIDRCAASGGGTVVVPKGVFVTGSIFLKQGVNLSVGKNAVLKGSQNTNDYPWIDTRIAGLEMKWPAALVNADGVTNLQISGAGTIDGSGESWWQDYWRVRALEKDGIDPHFKVARPRLVHIIRSEKVLVKDVTLKDSAFWNLQLTYCDGVEVRGVKVRVTGGKVRAASTDGIDVDSTRNVLIADCDIECDDDGICLKSGRDADGLRVNRPTENVIIRNCRVTRAAGLVVIGSETSGGIRHVRVEDCFAGSGCSEVVRFKTRMGRGGVVEDIVYENIQADGVRQVFNFNMDSFATTWLPEEFRAPVSEELGRPVFRDITVRNLTAKNCEAAGHIVGLLESPIINLTLENVDIRNAEKGFSVRNTRQFLCKNVKLNGKPFVAPAEISVGMNR